MKRIYAVLLTAILLAGCAAEVEPPQAIGEFNHGVESIDSHADDTAHSQLEFDFRSAVELGEETLGVSTPSYPRLKRRSDGGYLLFYQDGQIGWNIYCVSSSDLRTWSEPQELFTSHLIHADTDYRCYSTCDAVVLQDGRILAVCSFRSNSGYTRDLYGDGLALRISDDNGETWSEEREIYLGSNWEPQLLTLPSGEIQLYFTHAAPKVYFEQVTNSTGTAILRSFDRGETWTPNVQGPPFAADRVSQQFVGTNVNGVRLFTNQMPCAVALHNGEIALATESQLEGGYAISMAYSGDNWAVPLEMEEEGPADRLDNLFPGAAPYLVQFPSGETVLSYNEQTMYLRIGDAGAREFASRALPPFDALGYWGSIEPVGSHTIAAVFPDVTALGNRILLAKLHLCHRLDAPARTIRIDGSSADWEGNTHTVFVGSDSAAQLSLRAAQDGTYWYFCADWLSDSFTDDSVWELYLTTRSAKTLDHAVRLRVTPEGNLTAERLGEEGTPAGGLEGSSAKAALSEGNGCVVELAVRREWFGEAELALHPVLYHTDAAGRRTEDGIGLMQTADPSSWITLRPEAD